MDFAGVIQVGLPVALAFILLSMGLTLKPVNFAYNWSRVGK